MSEPTVFEIDRLDLNFTPKPWSFAETRRAEVDAYFAELQRAKPALWNGRVLLLHRQVVSDGVFRGDYLETDYASFTAWRHWAPPKSGVHDCFGASALVSADGGVLLGVMGEHTANAGQIYFPAGTPEPSDIVEGKVDLAWNIARELKEETGIDASDLTMERGWTTVVDGQLIVQIKILRSRLTADVLRRRILAHLASEKQPELAGVRFVRGPWDFVSAMPPHVPAFLKRFFDAGLANQPASA